MFVFFRVALTTKIAQIPFLCVPEKDKKLGTILPSSEP